MSKLKNILPVAIGLILVASSILAFGPAPTPAPTCDPATTPGCNAPINVGTIGQIKNGNLGLGGNFGLSSSSFIDFNSTVAGRTATAVEGKIAYDTATTSLKIYGAGTSPNRKVTIYDKICDSVGACKSVSEIVSENLIGKSCPSGQAVGGFNVDGSLSCFTPGSQINAGYTVVYNSSAGGNAGACTFTNLPSLPSLDKVPCSTSDTIPSPMTCSKVNTGSVLWPIYKYYLSCPSGSSVYLAWSTPDRTFVNKLDGMTNKCYQELAITTITANYACK
jgi:hypothetical protein